MDVIDKKAYIASKVWLDDKYLVNPDDATKICKLCQSWLYTVEFLDCDVFVDWKLPVCTRCWQSRKAKDNAYKLVLDTGKTKLCRICNKQKPIVEFVVDYDLTRSFTNRCTECKDAGLY